MLFLSLFFLTRASPIRACSLSPVSLSLVLVAAQGPPILPAGPCLARRIQCHRSAPSTGRHSASHRRCAMPRRPPAPRGISAKVGMSSSEPCPRPGAKDTSCTLRPCCALARAEPPQLRSSSGSKRYILNALLMLRTFECKRYTLKDTCRLNVRAHSSSSLPLQSAAYASASTRSLCAPQRAHRRRLLLSSVLSFWAKTDFTGTCCSKSPVHRLVWRVGGRAPPQLQRVLALSPPRVGRFPCAQLRTTRDAAPSPARRARSMHAAVAVEVFHLPPSAPCGEPDEGALRPTPLPADSCRTAGIEEMGLHRIRQSVGAPNRLPCLETAAPLTAVVYTYRLSRALGPSGDQADDRLGNV
jgi:hypothetical protein